MLKGPGFRLKDQNPRETSQLGTVFSQSLPNGYASKRTHEAETVIEGVRRVYKVFNPLATIQNIIPNTHMRSVRMGSVGSFSPRPMPAACKTSLMESVSTVRVSPARARQGRRGKDKILETHHRRSWRCRGSPFPSRRHSFRRPFLRDRKGKTGDQIIKKHLIR